MNNFRIYLLFCHFLDIIVLQDVSGNRQRKEAACVNFINNIFFSEAIEEWSWSYSAGESLIGSVPDREPYLVLSVFHNYNSQGMDRLYSYFLFILHKNNIKTGKPLPSIHDFPKSNTNFLRWTFPTNPGKTPFFNIFPIFWTVYVPPPLSSPFKNLSVYRSFHVHWLFCRKYCGWHLAVHWQK